MMRPVRVLITGVAGGSIGEQVYKALRRGRHRYEITVTNVSLSLTAVAQAEHSAVLPPADSEEYAGALLDLVRQEGVEFLVPGSEPELIQISRNRDLFSHAGVRLLINSEEVIATGIDKLRTNRQLQEKGFSVPQTFSIHQVGELQGMEARFPCVIKPATGSGSTAAFLAQTQDELEFFVRYLLNNGYQPLVQEYTGNADSEYTVGVLHHPDGSLAGSVALHRKILSGLSNRLRVPNRTANSELGSVLALSTGITQGTVVSFPALRHQAETIASALGSVGPLNIQGRWDGERFLPFEINPRFSGTTSIRAMVGFNEPEILIDWHLGIPHEPEPRQTEVEFVRGLMEYSIETRRTK